ncbi:uncharacterized protein LOC119988250 [Tripterygium wilfordii]|uniref:uncharacterized protein LOC119988250 n=1 Tax=Tripterygium wilfordii TaxID=458696 RepID=UPI0018F7E78E|nr:uncharacterized protein LOC119988250 [Tripterygium wilfordii]
MYIYVHHYLANNRVEGLIICTGYALMISVVDSPSNLEDGERWLPSSLINALDSPNPKLPYTTNYYDNMLHSPSQLYQINHTAAAAVPSFLNVSSNVQILDASFPIMPNGGGSRVPYAGHHHYASWNFGPPALSLLPLHHEGIERRRAMDFFGKCEGTGVFLPRRARFVKEVGESAAESTGTGAFFNHDVEVPGRKKRRNKKNHQRKFLNKDEKKAEESPSPSSELEICLPEEWTY